jgi:large subunit ribosomal protein L33
MAKKGEARQRITLKCTVCGEENYRTEKNKKNTTERLELDKFCSRCRKATPHKEEK